MPSFVFISYKHGDPSTRIARHLCDHLRAVGDALDFEIFMDEKDNVGGDVWNDNIEEALDKTTHFIALLDTAYWLSKECKRELQFVLERFERSKSPRVLFVKSQEIRPDLFRFDTQRQKGQLLDPDSKIRAVGDLHFLGPYDGNNQLVRLAWENPAALSDQIAQLLNRLERVLPSAG